KKLSLSPDVNVKVLASQTPGFAGAEIANAANEAALLASRRGKQSIEMKDFEDAIERVVAGLEKKNKVINPKEKKVVAYHESGHAIISWMMAENDAVQKISIVPRGMSALGYTMNLPLEDRYLMTKHELYSRICGLLGGRIAEEIIFDEISTGAQNDLEKITEIAYNMVVVYGMSKKLGNISYYESNNPYYGGPGVDKKYSEHTARLIDEEVHQLIDQAQQQVREILTENHDKLEMLAQELLKNEVLHYCKIEEILGRRPGASDDDAMSEECGKKAADRETGPDSNGKTPVDEEELKNLEAAVEKIRQSKNAEEN
ncbi:MAG: AAA family ATPase, partial [Chlorobium phaeobacteroides]|nr:AAA family ATPase [Chlorobium phaeobacteroides]